MADNYEFNGQEIPVLEEETRSWDGMTITFRSTKEVVRDRLRPLFSQSGDIDVIDRLDGGFDAVDRSGDDISVTVEPEDGREQIRTVDEWFVDDYDEEVIGRSGDVWEVEVELVPVKEKAHDNEYGTLDTPPSEDRPEGYWKFEFDFGDLVTRRVTTDLNRTPDGTIDSAELSFVLTEDEVRVLEESACKLAAVNLREVPDGEDLLEDATDDNRNTVDITPAEDAEDTVDAGEYIVREWEVVYNNAAYNVDLEVTKA